MRVARSSREALCFAACAAEAAFLAVSFGAHRDPAWAPAQARTALPYAESLLGSLEPESSWRHAHAAHLAAEHARSKSRLLSLSLSLEEEEEEPLTRTRVWYRAR